MSVDPYRVLGLKRSASRADVRTAFRRLARSCHPDLFGSDPLKAEQFKAISQAHDVLIKGVSARARETHRQGSTMCQPAPGHGEQPIFTYASASGPTTARKQRRSDPVDEMMSDIFSDLDGLASAITGAMTARPAYRKS